MDGKELYNLYEAYLEVVENQQLGEIFGMGRRRVPTASQLANSDWIKKANAEADRQAIENLKGMFSKDPEERKRTAHRMSRSPDAENRTDLRKVEQVDLYDIILSHLLDEGYVETLEAAEVIMVNMSEEWRDSILLEKKRQYDDGHGFDRSKHPDLDIDYDRPRGKNQNQSIRGYTRITHKPSGITYEVNHDKKHGEHNLPSDLKGKARKAHGHKPEHDIRWDHSQSMTGKEMTRGEKIRTARNAKRVWDKHIQHRIPSGHLVSNSPDDNYDDNRRNPDKNTRASIYKKSGFGKTNRMGKQYSTKIGNKLHPVNDDED